MKTTRRTMLGAAGAGLAGSALAAPTPDASRLLEAFAKRQTVRRYKMDPVPEEHLRLILDAARRAPTCMNQQPWKFLVVKDRAKIERMRKQTLELVHQQAANLPAEGREAKLKEAVALREGYFTAPVYVTVLVDTEAPCSNYAVQHDGPLAVGLLMVAARALGYGTAYLTDGIPDSVTRDVLAIPKRWHRVCITPIGLPDGWPEPKPKKKLEELVSYETI